MKWNEFLDKIRALRAAGGKLGFNAGVITRLIYAGTFNSMLTPGDEYMEMPAHKRCLRMTQEAVKAMESKAALPKASKTESVGIADIRNDAGLVLWRHIVNPLFQFNLSTLFKEHLRKTMGFQYSTTGNTRMLPMFLDIKDKPGCDLWARFGDIFTQPASLKLYQSGAKQCAIMGIITKTDKFTMKNGRTSLRIYFFDGYKEWEIKLWPEYGKTTYNVAKASYLNPCAVGLLVVKPDVYLGSKTGSLVHFYEMSL